MAELGTDIILVAGGLTFANEWYQTKVINWRVPIATLILSWAVEGVSRLNSTAGTGIGIAALIVASSTQFNGKSPVQTIGALFPPGGKQHA
jgi:hypothetical protein